MYECTEAGGIRNEPRPSVDLSFGPDGIGSLLCGFTVEEFSHFFLLSTNLLHFLLLHFLFHFHRGFVVIFVRIIHLVLFT